MSSKEITSGSIYRAISGSISSPVCALPAMVSWSLPDGRYPLTAAGLQATAVRSRQDTPTIEQN